MSITIPKGCKPSKVCGKDPTRPTLHHAWLLKRKDGLWLCATDSYTAVALKVEGTAKPGWIPVGALKHMEAGREAEQISKTAWTVETRDGFLTYDITKLLPSRENTVAPDFEKEGMNVIFTGFNGAARDAAPVGFNPTLLSNIGAALGGALKADIVAPLRPIRLTALNYEDSRMALQMPVRLIS